MTDLPEGVELTTLDSGVRVVTEVAPSVPPDEIDSEREVVLEEIAMYEDEPQDRVHDVLAEAMYGDQPLGRRVLGRADVIGGIPVPEIASYHQAHYRADNIVIAAAG